MAADLSTRLRQHADLLAALALSAATTESLDELLRGAIGEVRRRLSLDATVLLLRGAEGERLRPAAAEGLNPAMLRGHLALPGAGAAGGAAARREVVARYRPEGLTSADDPLAPGYQWMAALPLVRGSEVFGALLLLAREGAPVEPEEEAALGALGALLALTLDGPRARRLAAGRLRALERVVGALPCGVLAFDLEGRVTFASPGATRLLALEGNGAKGDAVTRLFPSRNETQVQGMVQQVLRFGLHCEDVLAQPSGGGSAARATAGPRWWLVMAPLRSEEGGEERIVGGVAVLQPVTREVEGGGADELTTSFVSVLSHELRTPLTSLKGAVHLIADAGPNETIETHRGLIAIIQKNTERLIRLIDDLIHVSQIENHALQPTWSVQSVEELLESAAGMVRAAAMSREVELRLDAPEGDPTVKVDRGLILQALRHVLDNAVKFSPEAGVVDVVARCPAEGGSLDIFVRDRGEGIAPDVQPTIFERFTQGEQVMTRRKGGNGLGLYIAREVMALHGGAIELLETGPGGTTFRLTLPTAS